MKEKGFILIVSLIFLVIMSMLGISMFSGVTMDETMSGNQREKNRSLDAVQMTLNTVETWLSNPLNTVLGGTLNPGVACTASTVQPAICASALATPATPATWPLSATLPATPGLTVSTSGGLNTYYSQPQYYIQFLGFYPGTTNTAMYQVTATAQGGNDSATSVVQAVYRVKATSVNLDNP